MTQASTPVRSDWRLEEIEALYQQPLLELVFQAQLVHRQYHAHQEVQLATLLSIKTGGCPEDCHYCAQSVHHHTDVKVEGLMDAETVRQAAQGALAIGATRLCMGAAWRNPPSESKFRQVLTMIEEVKKAGLEACCTLGMLTEAQAQRLAEAGLDYYNHNLDTSPEFYSHVITTRTYAQRLETLDRVRKAGIRLCTGGIIGMGETPRDVCSLLHQLATMDPHPASVPINALVAIQNTPLEGQAPVDPLDLVRTIATARLLMPASVVRLSAGRSSLSPEAHALAFMAGASSIFVGDRLLTAPNPGKNQDLELLARLGLRPAGTAAPLKLEDHPTRSFSC